MCASMYSNVKVASAASAQLNKIVKQRLTFRNNQQKRGLFDRNRVKEHSVCKQKELLFYLPIMTDI